MQQNTTIYKNLSNYIKKYKNYIWGPGGHGAIVGAWGPMGPRPRPHPTAPPRPHGPTAPNDDECFGVLGLEGGFIVLGGDWVAKFRAVPPKQYLFGTGSLNPYFQAPGPVKTGRGMFKYIFWQLLHRIVYGNS